MALTLDPTERWTERSYTPNSGATRVYEVPNATSDIDALNAIGSKFGIVANSPHPDDGTMHVAINGRVVSWDSPVMAIVRVTWAIGTFLIENAKIRWQIVYDSEQVDHDATGRPILNAAGNPVDPPPTNEFIKILLTVTRKEKKYDLSRAVQFSDTTNKDTVNPYGVGNLFPGQMHCVSIVPIGEYYPVPPPAYLFIVYSFEMRKGFVQDGDGVWDAFKWRFLNQGKRGFYNDPTDASDDNGNANVLAGEFFNSDGKQVSREVLLDAKGKPFNSDAGYKVSGSLLDAVENPDPLDKNLIEVTDSATFLKYPKKAQSTFSALGIF